jgi:adenylate cyclase class 2
VLLEVETKIIVPCGILGDIERRLKSKGFRFEWSGVERDIYFQHPCRDFSVTDEALRLREVKDSSGGFYILTWKGPKIRDSGVKAREEINFRFDRDGEVLKNVFLKLGFTYVATIEKHRSMYSGSNVRVFLDRVERLGCFVEVEALGEYSRAKTLVDIAMRNLELYSYESTVKSYLELYLERNRQ